MAYLWCVSASVMTAAMVVSEPVPAVVGTATKGGSFLPTLNSPAMSPSVFFGQAVSAAAALAASMGEPPPMARKPSQPCSSYSFFTLCTVTVCTPLADHLPGIDNTATIELRECPR